MRASRLLPVVVLVACGGGGSSKPDALIIRDDAATVDTPPPPPGCDYGELNDTGNDWNDGTFEQTGLVFSGNPLVVCGKINNGHYITDKQRVDVDSFLFEIGQDSDVELFVTAGAGVETLDSVIGYVSDQQGYYIAAVYFDHGVGIAHIPAGAYEFDLEAYSAADATAPIDYKLKLVADMPNTRCPKVTAATNYTEANDGPGNTGNDVFQIVYTPDYLVTETAANDAPETTGITVAGDMKYRITGTHAAVDQTDEYMDRDAYKITTGPTTNQLAIRLNWPGTTADLDYVLFNEASTTDVGGGTSIGNQEDEFNTFAVKPNTTYWLWVGMYDGSTAPVTYDVSVCGETFTP